MSIPASRDTQLKRSRLYPEIVHMPLDDANLCLDCDSLHTGEVCPVCASTYFMILSSVIGRLPQNTRFETLAPAQPYDTPLLRVIGKR